MALQSAVIRVQSQNPLEVKKFLTSWWFIFVSSCLCILEQLTVSVCSVVEP